MRRVKSEVKFITDTESGIFFLKNMIQDLESEIKNLKNVNLEKMVRLNQLYNTLHSVEK